MAVRSLLTHFVNVCCMFCAATRHKKPDVGLRIYRGKPANPLSCRPREPWLRALFFSSRGFIQETRACSGFRSWLVHARQVPITMILCKPQLTVVASQRRLSNLYIFNDRP